MTDNESSKEFISKRDHRHGMCGGRNSGVFWGIFFIAVGLFWLGKKANWFPAEYIEMFWPGALIFAGVWIVASVLMRSVDRRLRE